VARPCPAFRPGRAPARCFRDRVDRRSLSVSGCGARRFAPRATTLRISRDFTVRASARFARCGTRTWPLQARPRRPPTSCALRLRKPDRTIGLLTPSVTPRRLDRALLARSLHATLELPPGWPAASDLVHATAGLERCRSRCQDAFRWFDFMPCGRSRRLRAPSYVRPRSPRTLVARSESAPVVNEWTAVPGYPARLAEPFGPPRPRGKMRLPSFCNQQPLRAPSGPLDSRDRFRPWVEARLTTSSELQHGRDGSLLRLPSPLGPVEGLDQKALPERRTPSPAACSAGGRSPALPLTLPVAPSRR